MTKLLKCKRCGNGLGEIDRDDYYYVNLYDPSGNGKDFFVKYLISGEIRCQKCNGIYVWHLDKDIVKLIENIK